MWSVAKGNALIDLRKTVNTIILKVWALTNNDMFY